MSVSFGARLGLLAVLAGCVHQSAQSAATTPAQHETHTAQPFVSSWQHQAWQHSQAEALPLTAHKRASLPRGEALASFSWLAEPDSARVRHVDAACFVAARSPQPFAGAGALVATSSSERCERR